MAQEQTTRKDPIVDGSLNWHITLAAVVLAASVLWAFYDEAFGKRPWKAYQAEFVERYSGHLATVRDAAVAFEGGLQDDAALSALRGEIDTAQAAVADQIAKIDAEMIARVNPRVIRLTKAMQAVRSEVMALTYLLEHAYEGEKGKIESELDAVKARRVTVDKLIPLEGDPQPGTMEFDYQSLAAALDESKAFKAALLEERAQLGEPARRLRVEYDRIFAQKRPGLSAVQVDGLINKMSNFDRGIRQIHVPDPIGLVDRCETCHLGIREPLELSKEDLGGEFAGAFVSHPKPEMLKIHDPERFGCTPCHGGNGAATISVKEGHGHIKHWLWPMYDKENTEAGCLQCHEDALVLDHADTLNAGKELFRYRGCWGCHPREGFDVERAQQRLATQAVASVAATIEQKNWAIEEENKAADSPESSPPRIQAALAKIKELTLEISGLESELIELQRREKSLAAQLKNVGPSLRPVKEKLRPEWVTSWINNPREFRPTTRMPVFRLPEDHLLAISAAVWQNADEPKQPARHAPGDADRGKELFEARGCMACHAIGESTEGQWAGGQFAPELSRLAEKANYDYVVNWVKDTPDWSLMPNLRLSLDESRDIGSYLMTMKDEDAHFDSETAHLDDPALKEKGEMLIRHYGCAGCHDIAGFANVGKIGTDLTTEGNKPIERLDFGLHTHTAKRNHTSEGIQYNHKSFFEHKLNEPEFFDEGKVFDDPLARSRMPNFGFSDKEVAQVVTYMLGSVDSAVPEQMHHNPTGRAKDIVDGWWVIKKYNCVGCHQIVPGQVPDILRLPQFQGENAALAPPSLVGVGARLNPEWLAKFLRNPAMRDDDLDRNGVRTYLQVRMPTFNLWDEEIGALVRFFEALSNQTLPYFPPPMADLTEHEVKLAREAFLGADCLNCHASADQKGFDPSIIAPSFVHARDRLKPTWTERWILDPSKLMIGTRMPTGLFRWDEGRNVVAGQMTEELAQYHADHAKLFVRYMNTIDVDEANFLKGIKDAERQAAPAVEEEFLEE